MDQMREVFEIVNGSSARAGGELIAVSSISVTD